MTTQAVKPGDWVKHTKSWDELDFSKINMRIATDRYTSREFAEREREVDLVKSLAKSRSRR